ncbi:MAG TPA: hypothetical protein PKA64_18250, partial [Myxococcota bacterium]|nr:hypothetical protein [Myxococcota bacterium]
MITAPDAGGDVIPGGACAGVQTGLDRPRVLRSGSFDGAGDAEMSGSPSVNRRFQRWAFVDVSACVVTEVHWLR